MTPLHWFLLGLSAGIILGAFAYRSGVHKAKREAKGWTRWP